MTLVEILLVTLVVFIWLAMILSGRARLGKPAKQRLAQVQITDLVNDIRRYHADYGRYPVSANIETAALAAKEDFTYGGPQLNQILGPGSKTPANADVIAVLVDITNYYDGRPTINSNHNLNQRQIAYLNARFSGDTNSPGIGADLVYRDPWCHPYIISLDLNGDGWCRDAFFKHWMVSRMNGAAGFNGLTNTYSPSGSSDLFECHSGVMVWSLGPDGKADGSKPSKAPPNKDNILSWGE